MLARSTLLRTRVVRSGVPLGEFGMDLVRYNSAMRLMKSLFVCTMLGFLVANTESAAAAFCETPSTNPYLAVVEQLPKLHEPPMNGVLPFAPLIRMMPVRGTLVTNGEEIGFIFPVRQAGHQKWAKPWLKIKVSFEVLDRKGRVARVVEHSVGVVRWSDTNRITYATSSKNTLYRVNVQFEKLDGSHLGTYSRYFRSAAPKFSARIALNAPNFAPGETISARLENIGVSPIGAGYGYRVERFTGSAWEADSALQGNRSVPRVLVILGPAASFDCSTFPIPVNQAPGLYRLVKEVGRWGFGGKMVITSEFTVVGAGY